MGLGGRDLTERSLRFHAGCCIDCVAKQPELR